MLTLIGDNSLALVVIGNTLVSLGFGFTFTVTIDMVIAAAPPERAGAASALAETGAELGGALGLAVLGSLGMAVYRSGLASAMPAGISESLRHRALDTLGGAVDVADQLPNQPGAALLEAAHQAFIDGLQINALIGVIGFLGLAFLTATMLRNVEPHTGSEWESEAEHSAATLPVDPLLEMHSGD
jgi:DHA2 family multidrug resistance protein-like MFS transporter